MSETYDQELERFKLDQRDALLSLDEAKIREFGRRWQADMAIDPEVFWRAVHKARTALVSLPIEERRKSKRWLEQRGSTSYEDGDLEC